MTLWNRWARSGPVYAHLELWRQAYLPKQMQKERVGHHQNVKNSTLKIPVTKKSRILKEEAFSKVCVEILRNVL